MSTAAPKQSTDGLKQTRKRTASLVSPSENMEIYPEERETEDGALRLSIRRHGILQPLIVTLDNRIVSGNRRKRAAQALKQAFVPVLVLPVKWAKLSPDERLTLLREHNRSRDKSVDEQLRETLIDKVGKGEAHQLLKARRQKLEDKIYSVANLRDLGATRVRSAISSAKDEMVAAVQQVLRDLGPFLPITLRHIHYNLFDYRPLKNTNDKQSHYGNDARSYDCLTKLVNRMQLEGLISHGSVHDPTRPCVLFDVHPNARAFLTNCVDDLFAGFYRDLQQSQPHHIELFAEKITVQRILQPVAADYTLPLTIGRGFCSLPTTKNIVDRYFASGKESLIVIAATDLDPDGEQIVDALGKSLRDDFGIYDVRLVKAGVTPQQVEAYSLPPSCEAKVTSSNFKRFSAAHGSDAYELEALKPAQLQDCMREAIDSVLDIAAYNAEVEREAEDAQQIEDLRAETIEYMKKRLKNGTS